VIDAPIFASADYVTQIQGSGLNPLLQNYWMTIHPPTLFLGFASTAIPFAYAIAGLWTKEHKAWLKPALPWALFSGAILGTGILMGGAWAYEALSFGGYWAWDPVENMSLVPWLILIAGIHANLIARNTGHSIRSTYVFYLLTFIFIVYSTFLTRSGVLGETSVHAFTEMGLEAQLVAFIVFFLALSAVLFGVRYRSVPSPEKEEPTASKEFWMFIGTLVLLFSGLIITASTSLPVYNKIREFFDPLFQGRVITDPIPHYNKYQIWIAVFIGLLSGGAQFLRYREFNFGKHAPKFLLHTGVALALSGLLSYLTTKWIDVVAWQYLVLLFFGWFTIVSNADYLITFAKGNLKTAGSSMAHIGFGLMIVGILASGLNQEVISRNPFVMEGLIEGASNEQLRRNVLLFQGNPMIIGEYEATYVKDTIDVFTRTYTVNYKRRNQAGEVVEEFDLHPNVLYEKSFTKIAASNPSTKRYWNRDVFTHIASLPQVEIDLDFRRQREDSLNYRLLRLPIGQAATLRDTVDLSSVDTSVIKTYQVALRELDRAPHHPEYHPDPDDITLGATVAIRREGDDSTYVVHPMLALRGQLVYSYPAQINDLGVKVRLEDSIFETVFGAEESLDYQTFSFKRGEEATLNGYRLQFVGFNREPEHPNYRPDEDDIAVSAMIAVQAPDGQVYGAQPVYLIRDSRPLNLKDEVPAVGLHFRFVGIDPQTETIELLAAQAPPEARLIPIEVATNSLRSDYIVLEAIVFPGINLFWLGTSLMMIGLFMGMFYRLRGR
jgi:cytochrome c-type biogenesis protein CcmF